MDCTGDVDGIGRYLCFYAVTTPPPEHGIFSHMRDYAGNLPTTRRGRDNITVGIMMVLGNTTDRRAAWAAGTVNEVATLIEKVAHITQGIIVVLLIMLDNIAGNITELMGKEMVLMNVAVHDGLEDLITKAAETIVGHGF